MRFKWSSSCAGTWHSYLSYITSILAEGAIALSVTLSGGALFASWKLLQFLSSLTVKVILAIFMWASAQPIQLWYSGRAWLYMQIHVCRPHTYAHPCLPTHWATGRQTNIHHTDTSTVIPTRIQQHTYTQTHPHTCTHVHLTPIHQHIDKPTWVLSVQALATLCEAQAPVHKFDKLTWLVLGGDPAVRSRRVEQFTALWGL